MKKSKNFYYFLQAAEEGDLEALKICLGKEAIVNVQDEDGLTGVMLSAKHGHFDCAKMLLNYGADSLLLDNEGNNALIFAAELKDNQRMIDLLGQYPLNINHINDIGHSALIAASYNGFLSNARALIDLGANVDLMNTQNESALTYSIVYGQKKVFLFLTQAGVQYDKVDDFGWTPLFYAIQESNFFIINKLITLGAEVDRFDCNGISPLMKAVLTKKLEIVKTIIEKTKNISLKDNKAMTALDYAHSLKLTDIVKLFEN